MSDELRKDDLAWLAFCYVADELAAEERERFEERLAVDQAAREAVAAAVALTTDISAALQTRGTASETVEPVRAASSAGARKWFERIAWTACGAAACWLLLSVSGAFDPRRPNGPTKDISAADGALGELASNWAALLEETPAGEDAAITTAQDEPDDLQPVEEIDAASDWMVAAVLDEEMVADEEMESEDEELDFESRESEGA
jgi:hypothetical protein